MLSRGSRLRARVDFDQAFRQGKPFFLGEALLLITREKTEPSQIGVAFKGKNFPLASKRHYYKRRILEALRPSLEELPNGVRAVILFQKTFEDEAFSSFQKKAAEIISTLNKAKI